MPMASYCMGKGFGVRLDTGDVVPPFPADGISDVALGFNHSHRSRRGPAIPEGIQAVVVFWFFSCSRLLGNRFPSQR